MINLQVQGTVYQNDVLMTTLPVLSKGARCNNYPRMHKAEQLTWSEGYHRKRLQEG